MANYQAFEVKAGDVLNRVEALCRHLTNGGKFTESTPIKAADVDMFIDDSYYWLLGELSKNGYSTTVSDTEAKAVLQQIQALDAAAQIEFSQPVTDTGEPNDRYKSMAARRDRLVVDYLKTEALERLGATRSINKSDYLEMTGRSVSRKRTVYTDTDVLPSRFPRGFGQRPGTARSVNPETLEDSTQ